MMNKVMGFIKGIAKFFSYLLAVIAILVAAVYISDITREGTPFTSNVTTAEDAKLLDSHVWGFRDYTYRYHFTATPKTIDSIIKDKGLKPVMNEKLTQQSNIVRNDMPKNTDWNSPPGLIFIGDLSSKKLHSFVGYAAVCKQQIGIPHLD